MWNPNADSTGAPDGAARVRGLIVDECNARRCTGGVSETNDR